MDVLRRHGDLIGYMILTLALAFGAWTMEQRTNDSLKTLQFESCERGNRLRTVVWENTQTAASDQQRNSESWRSFQRQLDTMRSTPYFEPDGTVNCEQATYNNDGGEE